MHVGVVLGQDGDGITLLPDDEPRLLLRGAPQVYAIELGKHQEGLSDGVGAVDREEALGTWEHCGSLGGGGGKKGRFPWAPCRRAAPSHLQ